MPHRRLLSLQSSLRKLLPRALVEEQARACGAFKRMRKVDPFKFVWTIVLGFATADTRTLAGFRRIHQLVTNQSLEESSFYDRFSPAFVVLLRRLLDHVIDISWGLNRVATGRLKQFRDILITDSTVIRLHHLLAKSFPACRTNHTRAAAKVHLIMCAAGAGKQSVKVTSERRHDRRAFVLGPWVRGKLLLFDLGFFDYRLFCRIEDLGGHFVSRLKRSANPVIVAQNRLWRGRARPVVGERVWDVVDNLEREELDVIVEVRARHRIYAGRRSSERRQFRVVGLRDAATGAYHLYITTIDADALCPRDIASVYAVRWEIELVFKELKSQYRIDQLPSRKPAVVEALIYAGLLSLAASRTLLRALRAAAPAGEVVPARRWSVVFSQHAHCLLIAVVSGREQPGMSELLLRESLDPNRRRPHLIQSVEQGSHTYARASKSALRQQKAA